MKIQFLRISNTSSQYVPNANVDLLISKFSFNIILLLCVVFRKNQIIRFRGNTLLKITLNLSLFSKKKQSV